MRARLASLATLSLLPGLAGCLGHSADLRRGDEALAKQDYATAMRAYEGVLSDEHEEDADKDAAENGFERAWRAQGASKRAAEDAELAALEGASGAPFETLVAIRPLAVRIRAHANSEDSYARAKALAARLAPAAWGTVERRVAANDFLGAEAGALAIVSTPGVHAEYMDRLTAVRRDGASYHAARAAEATAHPAAGAFHRAVAAHFGGAPAPAARELLAAAQTFVEPTFEAPASCASSVEAIRGALGFRRPGGIPISVAITLTRCQVSDARRDERRTSTYVEHRKVGSRTETRQVTTNECRDVWKDGYRDVAVGATTTYQRSVGPGGVVHTTPQTQIRYERQKTRDLVKECGPVTREEAYEVPIYQDFTHNVPYVQTFRALSAQVEGTARASLAGNPDLTSAITKSDAFNDEAYDREVDVNRRETRVLRPIPSDAFLLSVAKEFGVDVAALAMKARLAHGERLAREAERTPRGPARDELLVRATLFGSEEAAKALTVSWSQLHELFAQKDPFPAPVPAQEPAATTSDAAPVPERKASTLGFTSSLYFEGLLGSVTTGDLPVAASRGATSGTTPASTFRESATALTMRMSFPLLGGWLEKKRGFMFLDEAAASASIVVGSSAPPQEYATSGPNAQAWAGYTAMLGFRTSSLGAFAGARAQAEVGSTGWVETDGAKSVPLCGRLEYRARGEFVPRATVCGGSVAGGERTSGELIVPFSSSEGTPYLVGRYESLRSAVTVRELTNVGIRDGQTTLNSMLVGIGWTN